MFFTIIIVIVGLILLSIILEFLFPRHLLLNDVTTTPDHPPHFRSIQRLPENEKIDMNFQQKAYILNKKYYSNLKPLYLDKSPSEAYSVALNMVKQMPNWRTINEDPRTLIIEAIAKTPLFGFRDYIVIEIRASDRGSTVNIRSKSRTGLGDLGINARRIIIYLAAFQQ